MLTAAWHPGGADAARSLLRALGASGQVFQTQRGGIALWADGRARFDEKRGAVILGDLSPPGEGDGCMELSLPGRGLRGNYAVAAGTPDGLLLGRGLLGGQPLYYRPLEGGAVVACSALEPLVALAPTRVDADVLGAFVACLLPERPEATFHRGISRVGCCEQVLVGQRGITRAKRQAPGLPERSLAIGADEAGEEIWRLLRAAAGRACAAARRIAVLAGGGVDSSGVLAAALSEARGAGSEEIFALALDFAGEGDDRPHLAALARQLGIEPVRISPSAGGPWLRDALVLDAAPYAGVAYDLAVPIAAREHGAELLVSGNYGDELFEGHLRSIAFEESLPLALFELARLHTPWRSSRAQRVVSFALAPRLKRLAPGFARRRTRRVLRQTVPWAGSRLQAILESGRFRGSDPAPVPTSPCDRYVAYAHHDRWCDTVEARGQLERFTGVPRNDVFQDEELVAFVSSLPSRLLVHGGMHRGLLRHALRGRVPESLRLRRDKAWFEPAIAQAVEAGGGFEALSDLATCERLADFGLVEPRAFREAFDRLRRDPSSIAVAELWSYVGMALAAEAFVRAHDEGRW